jgi:hypothetical protein
MGEEGHDFDSVFDALLHFISRVLAIEGLKIIQNLLHLFIASRHNIPPFLIKGLF